jgi:superfamily II helicase
MGSSKSKPIAESARSVLNKRQAQAPSPESLAQGVYFNVKNISVWYKPETLQKEIAPAQQAATTESTDLNPTLLREISKWDIVRSTTKDTQVRIHNVLISFFTMPMMFYNFIAKQFRFSTNLHYWTQKK